MVEQLGHWFNQRDGADRRDLYLIRTETGWQVKGRVGGTGGREVVHEFDDEASAKAMLRRMREAVPLARSDWAELRIFKPVPR